MVRTKRHSSFIKLFRDLVFTIGDLILTVITFVLMWKILWIKDASVKNISIMILCVVLLIVSAIRDVADAIREKGR